MNMLKNNNFHAGFFSALGLALLLIMLLLPWACVPVEAAVPQAAKPYQRLLVRTAHAHWGLEAPLATFAAQIHQESYWQPGVRSHAGAEGLAQFMPGTARWMVQLYPELTAANPYNPAWAMQAMVRYNRWLYARLKADTDCDRWAMVLAAYNGGLGWVLRDKNLAAAQGDSRWRWWDQVERHNAGRSQANFNENRAYPRRILLRHEPDYVRAGWGSGVCSTRYWL